MVVVTVSIVVVIVKVEPSVVTVVSPVVVALVVVVGVPISVCPQDPSSSPEEEVGLRTQRPESEDQEVRGPQQKQPRQQMGLPQDISPGVLGARDKDFDGWSVGAPLGWSEGEAVGDSVRRPGVLDQIN